MTNLSSQHHSFDIHLAQKYGVNEAILIHHFQHWIGINQRKPQGKKHSFKEGRWWTYQTLEDIAAHFPYLSKSEVFDIIEKLCLGKGRRSKKDQEFESVLIKGNFNKNKYDRTKWYAFADQKNFIKLTQDNNDIGASQNGDRLEPTPIPDTKPDTKSNKKEINKEKDKYLDFIHLTKNEYQKLLSLHGQDNLNSILNILNNYKGSNGKKYSSDYFAIKNWVEKRFSSEELSSKHSPSKKNKNDDLKRISPLYERYVAWYRRITDPYFLDRGFLVLEKDCFYDKKNCTYQYNINYEKFIEVLERDYKVPNHIIRG